MWKNQTEKLQATANGSTEGVSKKIRFGDSFREFPIETLHKAACGFFGAQTHHMWLFFSLLWRLFESASDAPEQKKDIPVCGFESCMWLLRDVPNISVSSSLIHIKTR
jgi:hypothetical protein